MYKPKPQNNMKKIVLGMILPILVLVSCNVGDDFKDLKVDLNTSLPLGKLEFSEASLFELSDVDTTLIRYDSDGCMVLNDSIEANIISDSQIDEFLSINFPDASIDIPIPGGVSGSFPVPENDNYFELTTDGGETLEEVVLNNGYINFSYDASLRDVTCTIKEITDVNGNALVVRSGERIDLTRGYTIKPLDGNKLTFVYSGTAYANGGSKLTTDVTFIDTEIFSVKGYLGRKEISSTSSSLQIDEGTNSFLNNIGEVYISDPYIGIDIDNNFNIPICVIIENITSNGVQIPLKEGFNTTRFLVDKGENSIVLNNDCTQSGNGISAVINNDFNDITISFKTIINPTDADLMAPAGTAPSGIDNYYDRDCKVKTLIRFGMPLKGYFNDINYTDNYDVELDLKSVNLTKAQMAITGTNTFPLDLSFDLYSIDRTGREVRMTNKSIVIPSTPDNEPMDKVTPTVLGKDNYILVDIDTDILNNLKDTETIRFKMNASSLDADNRRIIKIYKGSQIKLNLLLGAEGSVDINSNNK